MFNSITLDVTDRCNIDCRYCFVRNKNQNISEISIEQIFNLIDRFTKLDGKTIALSGGEPLLRIDLLDIIKYALNNDLEVSVLTNGTLLEDLLPKFIEKKLLSGKLHLQISLDGIQSSTVDYLRGLNTLHKVMNAIKMIDEQGYIGNISIATTLNHYNIREIHPLVEWAAQLKIPEIFFTFLRPTINCEKLDLSQDELYKAMKLLYELKNKYYETLKIMGEPFDNIDKRISNHTELFDHCDIGKTIKVSANGIIYPCPYFIDPKYAMGDIEQFCNNTTTVIDNINNFLGLVTRRRDKISKCKSCFWNYCCDSGCVAYAVAKYGSIYHEDPLCPARKIFFENHLGELLKGKRL